MPKQTVLIVEDDPTLLRGLKDNFALQGFDARTASDGKAGAEAAIAGPCDLMILDIMLPKVNGYEVCRLVRRQGLDMPIIMLTAKGQEEDIIRGLELGADDYVTKPFSIRELLARARAFLRRREAGDASEYCFGRCRLDLASHKLFLGEVETPLTAKEFRLLAHFVRWPGRAMTRGEILNAVWGHSIVVTARSVDRCVATLRSKIESDTRRPKHIITIRDIGYRFEPCDEA